jgi:hypothetical protein
MDIEQIIREAKIVRPDLAVEILSKYEHPNGMSVELVRKLLFGYKEGLCESPQIKQTLRSAITYAEHALSQIPEEPERNKGITRGQLSHYLSLFYEKNQNEDALKTAYEHITNSINDAAEYRDWSPIDERTRARNKLIDKLKPTDVATWTLRGANDNSKTANDLEKNEYPYNEIISGLYFRAAKLYREASHEFGDKNDSASILSIGYDCLKKSISKTLRKNTKMMEAAEFSHAIYLNTRNKTYRIETIKILEELSKNVDREIAFQARKKLKKINSQS